MLSLIALTVNIQFKTAANLFMLIVVSTWMGDRLWVGKPSLYVTSHLGQLSLPSLQGR